MLKTAEKPASTNLATSFADLVKDPLTFRITAYDGSTAGPSDAPITLHLRSPKAAAYLVGSPNSLGFARAYVSGELTVDGVHPGNPYEVLRLLGDTLYGVKFDAKAALRLVNQIGMRQLLPPPSPPPQEATPEWRRLVSGRRHSKSRDSEAIRHHYDVSNTFYSYVLGPSMTYTCACYPTEDATLEEAQAHKYDLVSRKLGLQPGWRLLDVGCGWGGMVMHAAERYGVHALGVTLSKQQATWAQQEIKRRGLQDRVEVRHADYRDTAEDGFDAVSSIGLTEHIGVRNYPAYFEFLLSRLRPGGRLLNHCITRPDNTSAAHVRGFIDRYVFPDGELTGSGRIISAMQDAGFEVRHEENLREHYARTCGAWCDNIVANWDACVAEAGEATAKVWGLYLAGSRLGFETNNIQLHQVLGVKLHSDGRADYPLRHDFGV